MPDAIEIEVALPDPAWTHALGRVLGQRCRPGDVLALVGGLGAGKTSLSRGLARGLGVPTAVPITSPTFGLLHAYQGRLPLQHLDLYRLEGVDDLYDLGIEDFLGAEGVTALEWADRFSPEVPGAALWVTLRTVGAQRVATLACMEGSWADRLAGVEGALREVRNQLADAEDGFEF